MVTEFKQKDKKEWNKQLKVLLVLCLGDIPQTTEKGIVKSIDIPTGRIDLIFNHSNLNKFIEIPREFDKIIEK